MKRVKLKTVESTAGGTDVMADSLNQEDLNAKMLTN